MNRCHRFGLRWELTHKLTLSRICAACSSDMGGSVAAVICPQTLMHQWVSQTWKTFTAQFWWPTHPVQHFRPALHGYTLEHCQHGEGEVVKVGDAVVGALPSHFAHCAVSPTVSAVGALGCTRRWLFLCNDFCDKI